MSKPLLIITLIAVLMFSMTACSTERPEFTLENYIRVDGSTVTIPLSEAIAAALTTETIDTVRPYILHNKTHSAYVNLIDGKTDLIFVTSPSEEELEYAKEKDVELEVVPIVSEAFVFLTHVENPVNDLTLDEIQKIYAGEITNWSEVGGEDVPIIPYQRPVNSGSQTGFLELVMGEKTPIEPPLEQIQAGMGMLIDAVATYENAPDAIGYSYYYFVVDMWGNEKVKLLQVDGVYPDQESISSGQYPIQTAYYAVFRKSESEGSDIRKVVTWILTDEGQQLAEEAGYVKVK